MQPASFDLDRYQVPDGVHDEMLVAPGVVRPCWQAAAEWFRALAVGDLQRQSEQTQRLLLENGLRYNPYSSDTPTLSAETRPWVVNLIPLLIPSREWRQLTAGLEQRARLLDALLIDLYGPQKLLRRGLVPAALLYSHPGFARPLHGLPLQGGRRLHYYAADLARFPDGAWRLVGDRTDSPFGAGYALENRIVLSRVLSGLFQSSEVERLAPFFLALRETLRALAPHHADNPRIVLLTQGPSGPSWFEDVYLARYLGFALVESGDLAVRDARVFLKTLGGLLPVDVIFRRFSDLLCDPLELRGDVALGVSGLVQAVRAGHVAVVNPLGSSLVESPAFHPFLPDLCRELLGQDLLLPSLETRRAGELDADPYSEARRGLRPAFRHFSRETILRERLDRLSPADLAQAIRERPMDYVVQEPIIRSTIPAWTEQGLRPASVALRVYLVASGDGYVAMPGGLVRVAENSSALDQSILAGEASKDAWVLSEGPVKPVTLLQPPGAPILLRRSGAELPSRVADNMFWLGRHVERVEGLVRLLRPLLIRLTGEAADEPGRTGTSTPRRRLPEIDVLLRALAERGQLEPGFVLEGMRHTLPAVDRILPTAILDETQPNSLRAGIATILRVAGLVRDRLSGDAWRTISRLDRDMRTLSRQGRVELGDVLVMLNNVLIDLAAFAGLVQENATRTLGRRFLDLGRRLERAQQMTALLRDVTSRSTDDESETAAVLEVLLEVADSVMTYRSRYLAALQPAAALDLVLTDETNPRSLVFQLAVIAEHVDHLPRDPDEAVRSREDREAMIVLNEVRSADVERLARPDPEARSRLDELLQRISRRLPRLAEHISRRYLIHAGSPRSLTPDGLGR